MGKKTKKKRQQSNRYSLIDFTCERRPVTTKDKWCHKRQPKYDGQPIGDAPYGYVVTVPYLPNTSTFLDDVDGRIIRCKKRGNKLLLQVIPNTFDVPQYGIDSFSRLEPNRNAYNRRKKKDQLYRILNIRNLRKSGGKFNKCDKQ